MFLHSPGELLTKELLLDRLWPSINVTEANLSQTVYLARKALGDFGEPINSDKERLIVFVLYPGLTPLDLIGPLQVFVRPRGQKTLLYLHGLGSSKRDVLPVIHEDLFAEYSLVALDFPGCGESPYYAHTALTISNLAELTDQFISRLGLTSVTVIGHSMGGLTGLFLTERCKAVKQFINIEGNLAAEDCFLTREVVQYNFGEFVAKDFLGNLKRRLARSSHPGVRIYSAYFQKEVVERAFFDYSYSLVNYSDNFALIDLFTTLTIPVMFVHGSANAHLSYIPTLKQKGVRTAEIADSHHWPLYDNPRGLYQAVGEFLTDSDRQ